MIDPDVRRKAIAILEAASESVARSEQHYALTAQQIGLDVEFYDDGSKWGDGRGPDMPAVELASLAWLRIDPEPHGIEGPQDTKRDKIAAQQLREGWDPPP